MSLDRDAYFARPTRRHLLTACCILIGFSVLGLLSSAMWTTRYPFSYAVPEETVRTVLGYSQHALDSRPPDPYDSKNYLRGPPTDNFRDSLLPDQQYITSWISAGWTNDVMTYINLIYLGILTDRIPILPMFTPSHIGGRVPPIDFGEVFDVPRLRTAMRRPLVEWHEVKNRSAAAVQELGCWNTWEAVQEREKYARRSTVPDRLRLDISYTKAPTWIKVIPRFEHDRFADFASLSALAFPEGRAEYAREPAPAPKSKAKLPPDEHMLCYDYLYYVCAHQPSEFEFAYSPAWMFVGQHMHWTPRLEGLAVQYVRRALGVERLSTPTPPYIGIHMRHGDFAAWCSGTPLAECFAPIPVIARRVEEVRREILERKGVDVRHVIMTSDEKNATWWQAVAEQGWYRVNTTETVAHYGEWYPLLIDAVIQSGGMGFVGTDRSTMSLLARRRVQAWRDGAVRTIRWGKSGSDDH